MPLLPERAINFEGHYFHSSLQCDINVVFVHGNSYNCHMSNGGHLVARYQKGHVFTTESEKGLECNDGSVSWKGTNNTRFHWYSMLNSIFL